MSMSTSVYGIGEPDAEWKKKVAAWNACKAAGVSPPEDLEDYFDNLGCLPPTAEKGPKMNLEKTACCKPWKDDASSGFEIEIAKIPVGLTHIRFCNSW